MILLQSTSGCSSEREAEHPQTAPVTGSVTYQGNPVLDGLVTFHPQGTGNPALGNVDENGNFELTTYEKGDGAVLGEHVVTVQVMPAAAVPGMEAETGGGISIPKKYNRPETSPLKVQIKAGTNEFQLKVDE